MVDRDQLKQVFFNIVINASEAMVDGGTIKIRTEWLKERSQVAVYFEDNGPGINTADLDKLFDPFFTTKEMGTAWAGRFLRHHQSPPGQYRNQEQTGGGLPGHGYASSRTHQ